MRIKKKPIGLRHVHGHYKLLDITLIDGKYLIMQFRQSPISKSMN